MVKIAGVRGEAFNSSDKLRAVLCRTPLGTPLEDSGDTILVNDRPTMSRSEAMRCGISQSQAAGGSAQANRLSQSPDSQPRRQRETNPHVCSTGGLD
jgi:hypothetical protein